METYISDPKEFPRERPVEQYRSVQEQDCEAAALMSHISK